MFCKRFGATWKDSLRLIGLTLDYSISIRSKTKKYQLQSDNEIHCVNVNYESIKFPLYFRRQDLSMLYEVWMDLSYSINVKSVSLGTVLDLGAHVGFTTLYYWTQLGDDRNYVCIEGSTKNASVLKLNMNVITKSSTIQSVITSNSRKIRFYDEMSGHLHQVHDRKGKIQESKSINKLLIPFTSDIALCKIDIEGMECEIITQNNTWLNKVSQLHLELHKESEYGTIKETLSKFDLIASDAREIKHFVKKKVSGDT